MKHLILLLITAALPVFAGSIQPTSEEIARDKVASYGSTLSLAGGANIYSSGQSAKIQRALGGLHLAYGTSVKGLWVYGTLANVTSGTTFHAVLGSPGYSSGTVTSGTAGATFASTSALIRTPTATGPDFTWAVQAISTGTSINQGLIGRPSGSSAVFPVMSYCVATTTNAGLSLEGTSGISRANAGQGNWGIYITSNSGTDLQKILLANYGLSGNAGAVADSNPSYDVSVGNRNGSSQALVGSIRWVVYLDRYTDSPETRRLYFLLRRTLGADDSLPTY